MEAEKKMVRKDIRPEQIVEELKRLYPKAECALTYEGDLGAFSLWQGYGTMYGCTRQSGL